MSDFIYWTLVNSSQMLLENTDGFLSPPELQRLSTLHFPKRRDEWLLGRWAAKSLAQSIPTYQHYSLDEIEIQNAPEGAPYIRPPGGSTSPDCLSISHSDRFALCALSLGPMIRIGADLEMIEPRSDAFIADYFTRSEQQLIGTLPVGQRAAASNLIWSTKESHAQALGVGLRWDTRKVEVCEFEGLRSLHTAHGRWQKLRVRDLEQGNRVWTAWWQQQSQFIITLAGYATKRIDIQSTLLVEKWFTKGLAA